MAASDKGDPDDSQSLKPCRRAHVALITSIEKYFTHLLEEERAKSLQSIVLIHKILSFNGFVWQRSVLRNKINYTVESSQHTHHL